MDKIKFVQFSKFKKQFPLVKCQEYDNNKVVSWTMHLTKNLQKKKKVECKEYGHANLGNKCQEHYSVEQNICGVFIDNKLCRQSITQNNRCKDHQKTSQLCRGVTKKNKTPCKNNGNLSKKFGFCHLHYNTDELKECNYIEHIEDNSINKQIQTIGNNFHLLKIIIFIKYNSNIYVINNIEEYLLLDNLSSLYTNLYFIPVFVDEKLYPIITDKIDVNIKNDRPALTKNLRRLVFEKKFGTKTRYGICEAAQCKKAIDIMSYHLAHIIPHSKGGLSHIDNFRCSCPSCNITMGDKKFDEYNDEINEVLTTKRNMFFKWF